MIYLFYFSKIIYRFFLQPIGHGYRHVVHWLTNNAHAVTAFAIIIAGVWTAWVFIYRNVYVPLKAPLHLSPEINLSVGKTREGRIPILVDISIKNNSRQKAYFLLTIFEARGAKHHNKIWTNKEFMNKLEQIWVGRENIDRYEKDKTLVSAGYLYFGNSLMPGESRYASTLFYIPEEVYDSVDVHADFYAVRKENKIWQKVKFYENGGYRAITCRVKAERPKNCIENLYVDRGFRLLNFRPQLSDKRKSRIEEKNEYFIVADQREGSNNYYVYFKRDPDQSANKIIQSKGSQSEVGKEIITKKNEPKLYKLIDKYRDQFIPYGTKLTGSERRSKELIKAVNNFIKLKGGEPLPTEKNSLDKKMINEVGYFNFPATEKIWLFPHQGWKYHSPYF